MSLLTTTLLFCRSQRRKPCQVHRLYNAKSSESSHNGLSRTERRSMMRKQKNRKQRKAGNASAKAGHTIDQKTSLSDHIMNKMSFIIRPKVPGGGNIYFTRQHIEPLFYRLPLAAILFFLLTNDDCFPYMIQGSIGPSMLPTIQYIGDLWLIETWAWYRLLGLEANLSVGDIVLWKDPNTQRVSCKRIVGLEGDNVRRFGQYVRSYRDREDLGISFPTDQKSSYIRCGWDVSKSRDKNNINQSIMIPQGHVWVEGDCPLFSMDSRQYGFIPKAWIRGRLLYRVWPFVRRDENGNQIPLRVNRDRPIPFSSKEDYLGSRYNFYKVPK